MRAKSIGLMALAIALASLPACNSAGETSAANGNPTSNTVVQAQVSPSATASPLPPSATPTPTATATSTPTGTPLPTETPTVTPSPTVTPTPTPSLMQVTAGGCCVQPFFSPDSQQVLFIDKPAENAPVGIYGVALTGTLPITPALVEEVIGFRSPDRTIVATMNGDLAEFSNEATGESWQINTNGNWPRFSPDASQIVWTATDREGPYDQRQTDLWLANLDGSNARKLLSLFGGGFSGWFPDGKHILLVGRDTAFAENRNLYKYNINTGERIDLASHPRLRGIELSPGGNHAVFYVDFADEPKNRGVWLVSTDGMTRQKLELPGFGAYQWRTDDTLLVIPMRANPADSMQLWALQVMTNNATPLTNPAVTPLFISNGDWSLSPDGNKIAFVNNADNNIWLLQLP